jgi:hypothetical protein
MPQDVFYLSVSTASFTLLGLWLVVVHARDEWRLVVARRRMAYVASLHFLVPGAMSVLALAAPGLVQAVGLSLTPLQVEAVVLSLLLFFGVQTAWFLLLEPTREERRERAEAHDHTMKAAAEGV